MRDYKMTTKIFEFRSFFTWNILWEPGNPEASPLNTGRKLNAHKTSRRCPGRLLNILRTFNLRPVSTEIFKTMLARLFPMWKHHKTVRFSNVFSGWRKGALTETITKCTLQKRYPEKFRKVHTLVSGCLFK